MYKTPILKKEKDYKELSRADLIEEKIPIPKYSPDTEDGKYVFFSIPGMLKMFAKNHICNTLWLNFADCLDLEIGEEKFKRSVDYIESLVKVKNNPNFNKFKKIIEIALDKVQLLFRDINNFIEFMRLCEVFGKEYRFFTSEKELDKPLEFYADFYFPFLNRISKKIEIFY